MRSYECVVSRQNPLEKFGDRKYVLQTGYRFETGKPAYRFTDSQA